MSASNEWTEWHLTPRGWEIGSEKMDFSPVRVRNPPTDRALSVKYNEYIATGFTKMEAIQSEIWRSNDESAITGLLDKFGRAPRQL
jgi:hypothetical protein